MARFDLFQGGNRVPMTVEDDPDNAGQYVLPGARALGTPGTGEPAHAGGSTGLIGWARDILANGASLLAKIAAFGTAAAPSADVMSVQYPNAYVGKATLAGANQALIVDTLGAAQIAFHFPQGTVSTTVTIEGANSNAATPVWTAMKFIRPSPPEAVSNLSYVGTGSGQGFGAGDIILVSCAGHDQIRCRVITYSSALEVLASRIFSPGLNHVFAELSNQTVIPVSVSAVSQINGFAATAYGAQFADTTTVLASGATFTSSARNSVSGSIGSYTITINSDQASAADGVKIQRSIDSVTWFDSWAGSLAANTPLQERVWVTDPFMRVSYTNGATPQTSFLLSSATRVN